MSTIPTPDTDAAHRKCSGLYQAASAANGFLEHARTLERELARERERVRVLREACNILASWEQGDDPDDDGSAGVARAALAATEGAP